MKKFGLALSGGGYLAGDHTILAFKLLSLKAGYTSVRTWLYQQPRLPADERTGIAVACTRPERR